MMPATCKVNRQSDLEQQKNTRTAFIRRFIAPNTVWLFGTRAIKIYCKICFWELVALFFEKKTVKQVPKGKKDIILVGISYRYMFLHCVSQTHLFTRQITPFSLK